MGNRLDAAGPDLKLARLAGGITYQPQFTFNERRRAIADTINSELTNLSPSQAWSPRGFEVSLVGDDKVRVKHLKHQGWGALIGDRDISFQYDSPERSSMPETLRVQTELFARLLNRLEVQPVRSIGLKFVALRSGAGVAITETARRLIPSAIQDANGLTTTGALPSEVTIRVAYPINNGAASASLQIGIDVESDTFVVDLDCACRDSFAMPDDHLQFYTDCLTHYDDVERKVVDELLQLPPSETKALTN